MTETYNSPAIRARQIAPGRPVNEAWERGVNTPPRPILRIGVLAAGCLDDGLVELPAGDDVVTVDLSDIGGGHSAEALFSICRDPDTGRAA